MLKTIANVVRFSTRPDRFRVVAKKILARIDAIGGGGAARDARLWYSERSLDYGAWATGEDAELWSEAETFARDFETLARVRLRDAKIQFGGGGAFALLYFLVRKRRPEFVVETGVAAGWSSAAILTAMEKNGTGHLWSSDFPYFRQAGAAEEIGFLVSPALRKRWTLLIDGDEANLPKILREVPRIDMFHFDSDKSYKGRTFALDAVRPKLAEGACVIFDDVQDNAHFKDIANPRALVFEERGKYLGMLGM